MRKSWFLSAAFATSVSLAPPLLPSPEAAVIPDNVVFNVNGFVNGSVSLGCRNLNIDPNREFTKTKIFQGDTSGGVYLLFCSSTGMTLPLPEQVIRMATTGMIDNEGNLSVNWYASGIVLDYVELTNLRTNDQVFMRGGANQVFEWPNTLPIKPGDKVKIVVRGMVKSPSVPECPCASPERIEWLFASAANACPGRGGVNTCSVSSTGVNFAFSNGNGLPSFSGYAMNTEQRRECSIGLYASDRPWAFNIRINLTPEQGAACIAVMQPLCSN